MPREYGMEKELQGNVAWSGVSWERFLIRDSLSILFKLDIKENIHLPGYISRVRAMVFYEGRKLPPEQRIETQNGENKKAYPE